MNEKRSIYDTDPLDVDVARRAARVWSVTEAPTRRFDENAEYHARNTYHSENAAPTNFTLHETTGFQMKQRGTVHQSSSDENNRRTVARVGLPENVLATAVYLPVMAGGLIAIAELLFVPRSEGRVRFHAAQALALHLAVLLAGGLLKFSGRLASSVFGNAGGGIINLMAAALAIASTVYFIMMMVRAWKGEAGAIECLAKHTRLLDEKIEPVK